ncbi:GNAT family N-acetyltransferase [Microbulbifer taiwanensis]|uniref:GNAT family N-acetyltransferase n=1 Tax=Microbulbifer taiwanensis TaxID=986746 RepID=UPI003618C685
MKKLIEPLTERLLLRQWCNEDRAPFAELNADPRVMKYFPGIQTRQESDASVDRASAHIAEHGWGFWALERLEDNRFIGFVGIKHAPEELPFSPVWKLAGVSGFPIGAMVMPPKPRAHHWMWPSRYWG